MTQRLFIWVQYFQFYEQFEIHCHFQNLSFFKDNVLSPLKEARNKSTEPKLMIFVSFNSEKDALSG